MQNAASKGPKKLKGQNKGVLKTLVLFAQNLLVRKISTNYAENIFDFETQTCDGRHIFGTSLGG